MSTPSAYNQYNINNASFTSADITSNTFTDGVVTVYYNKVGKLYFNIFTVNSGFSPKVFLAGSSVVGDRTNTLNRIASKLGITVNTAYYVTPSQATTNNQSSFYNTGISNWDVQTNGAAPTCIEAILAN